MSLINTRYGRFNIIDNDTMISHSLRLYGEWAQHEINLLAHFIRQGFVVADIGAFIGTHARAFSAFVGSSGKVLAFEPRHVSVTVLTENARLAPINNVRVINAALGATKEIVTVTSLHADTNANFGSFALEPCKNEHLSGEQVTITPLDAYKLDQLDFVKIDVEGMEFDVLKGAIGTLKRCRPVMFLECNALEAGVPIIKWCRDERYQVYGVLSVAYNQQNYAGCTENMFGVSQETGILLIPSESYPKYEESVSIVERLPSIKTADDLALLLLHKPQYPYEILAHSIAATNLSLAYPSPEADRLNQAVAERDGQVSNLNQAVAERDGQIASLNQTVSESRNEIDAYRLSASWRVTQPLRKVSGWSRRLIRFVQRYRNDRSVYSDSPPLSRKCRVNRFDLLHDHFARGLICNPVLIFDHNTGGGTNVYTGEIVKSTHAAGSAVLRVYYSDADWFVQWIGGGDGMLFYTHSIDELFKVLLMSRSTRIVVNSLYGYPDIKGAISNIVGLVQTLTAVLDFNVNDFFALCSSPHLYDFNGEYCGVPQDPEVCKGCLKKNISWYYKENQPTDIAEWRQPFAQILEVATTVSFFDSSSVEIVRRAFHLEDHKIRIVPHNDDYFDCDKQMDLSGPLHIGVLGVLSSIKGGKVVTALYDYIDKQGMQTPITIVGPSFIDTSPKINVHGPYAQKDLPMIVSQQAINVILMPSIVPETFSYTISEAMKMGLPIVAFDIGAQGGRVKKYTLGKVVPLGSSPAIILDAIQAVLTSAKVATI